MATCLSLPAAVKPQRGLGGPRGRSAPVTTPAWRGLEALERFFDHVPRDAAMAFVVVQHLSPDFKSLMDELLARRTSMRIRQAEHGMLVEPDNIYLLPANKEMIIRDRRLLLSNRDPRHGLLLPIDLFFRSLAQDGTGRPPVDPSFVGSFLRLGYVPSPLTAFRGVEKLAPGTVLEVALDTGDWIPAATTIWTGGFRANALAGQLGVPLDEAGRVAVDESLQVTNVAGVFAAGDVARAIADRHEDQVYVAPMSCQCAIPMGEIAGYNAAADLLGLARRRFAHTDYVTCLDLGPAGALFMEGWTRAVRLTGLWGKIMKETINTRLIYPPRQAATPGRDVRPAA